MNASPVTKPNPVFDAETAPKLRDRLITLVAGRARLIASSSVSESSPEPSLTKMSSSPTPRAASCSSTASSSVKSGGSDSAL